MANKNYTFIIDDSQNSVTEIYYAATAEEAMSKYLKAYFDAEEGFNGEGSDFFKSYSVDIYKVAESYKAKISKTVQPSPYYATLTKGATK